MYVCMHVCMYVCTYLTLSDEASVVFVKITVAALHINTMILKREEGRVVGLKICCDIYTQCLRNKKIFNPKMYMPPAVQRVID